MFKIQPLEFFNTLYKNCKEGKLEIYYPDFDEHRIFPIANLKEKSLFFPRDRKVNFRIIACDAKGKLDENAVRVPAIWLEIKNPKQADIKKKMHDFKLKPSLVIDSTNTMQFYWVLNIPLKMDQIENIKMILNKYASRFGGTMDLSVSDGFLRAPDCFSQAHRNEELKYYDFAELEKMIIGSEPGNSGSNEIPNLAEESKASIEVDLGWD
jgi:hypothetical protein